jgi:hypothetical protein
VKHSFLDNQLAFVPVVQTFCYIEIVLCMSWCLMCHHQALSVSLLPNSSALLRAVVTNPNYFFLVI